MNINYKADNKFIPNNNYYLIEFYQYYPFFCQNQLGTISHRVLLKLLIPSFAFDDTISSELLDGFSFLTISLEGWLPMQKKKDGSSVPILKLFNDH